MTLPGGPGLDRFPAICKAVRAGRRALAMAKLSAAANLALEEAKEKPDPSELGRLRRLLGLGEEW